MKEDGVDLLEDFVFQMEEVSACPLCGGTDNEFKASKPGMVSKDMEYDLNYVECKSCGHIYMNPRPDDATLNALYSTGSYRGMLGNMSPTLDNFADEAWRGIRISSLISSMVVEGTIALNSIIDIGGSTGMLLYCITRAIWDRNNKQKITKVMNVELNPRFSIWGRQKGFLDVRTMKQASAYAPFDLVTCVHVLEHTNHPREFLAEVVSMGKTGSTYYIEVPRPRNSFGIFHPQVFTPENLASLCKELGLKPIFGGEIKVENTESREHMVLARRV